MSKGKGQKIAIKFDKPILGDVTGNESAFTITGMVRNPLETGELQPKQFAVDKVERYPISTLYEDDFTGTMNGVEVGVNGVALESEIISGDEDRHDVNTQSGGTYDWIEYRIESKKTTNIVAITYRSRSTGVHTLSFRDWDGNEIANSQASGVSAGSWYTFILSASVPVSQGVRYKIYITRPNTTLYRAQSLYDGAIWKSLGVLVSIGEFNETAAMGLVEGINEYSELGTHTPPPIDATTLPTNPRIKYDTDLPTGTSITVEYALNQDALTAPETWTAVNSDDLLAIPDPATGYFLWLRYTLETQDTAVTPTLLAVWIEEAESPPDTILLSFDTYNRFNDVEGDITVAYNQSLGTLAGARPVESFSVDFTPTDLEPTPIDEHTITAGIDLTVDLIDLEFTEIYADHNVTHTATAGVDLTVALIDIDDINP